MLIEVRIAWCFKAQGIATANGSAKATAPTAFRRAKYERTTGSRAAGAFSIVHLGLFRDVHSRGFQTAGKHLGADGNSELTFTLEHSRRSGDGKRFVEAGAFCLFHFAGLENFTAIETLDVLGVVVLGDQ